MCSMETAERPTRKSLPLNARDLSDLSALRRSPAHRAVLADLAGTPLSETSSEAAVLHAIWEAGVQAVRDRVEEAGYAALAAERDPIAGKAVARRRRPTWADEK